MLLTPSASSRYVPRVGSRKQKVVVRLTSAHHSTSIFSSPHPILTDLLREVLRGRQQAPRWLELFTRQPSTFPLGFILLEFLTTSNTTRFHIMEKGENVIFTHHRTQWMIFFFFFFAKKKRKEKKKIVTRSSKRIRIYTKCQISDPKYSAAATFIWYCLVYFL